MLSKVFKYFQFHLNYFKNIFMEILFCREDSPVKNLYQRIRNLRSFWQPTNLELQVQTPITLQLRDATSNFELSC